MLAGLQGSGKTTLAGKLALWLRSQGHTPLLVAADLQRPNAVTQLQIVGQQAGVQVYAPEPGNGVGDPVDVSRRGVAEARARQYDIVVVDTAGRLGIDAEMMRQAVDIRDAVRPNEILFVIDAMIGQDAVSTSEAFRDGVGFSGVVLTKLDGDARGGAALSVRQVTGAPILFASNGERLEDFDVFHPDRMASRILGMGDLLTLIEQAEQAFDAEQAEQTAAKIGSGELTLEDFLEQMQAIRKMGPIANLLGMLPGAGAMKEQLKQIDDRDLDRTAAIIRSMTPEERINSKIINASRRVRIANGSGVSVTDVNQLLERFVQAQKMMGQMAGSMGLPGMGPMSKKARGRQMQAQAKKGKKGKGKAGAGKKAGGPARRPTGAPGGLPGGFPTGGGNPFGGQPGGMPGLPPGQGLPDLTKLNFDQLKDERPGR
jgi:signal recognition particle subunit SRP54